MQLDTSRRPIRSPFLRLFEYLLALYPPHFRGEFSIEIREIILSRLHDAEQHGGLTLLAAVFQEITGLIISILRECWHEHRVGKEKAMNSEDQFPKSTGRGGLADLRPAGTPSVLWLTSWTLLTTAAIPVGMIAGGPLAVLLMWPITQGSKAGLWPAVAMSNLEYPGFVLSIALMLSVFQWLLLRNFMPRAWLWLITTGAGILVGGLVSGLILMGSSIEGWKAFFIMAALLLPMGLALGVAHWLYLRRFLPNAFRIIFIDVLALGSLLVTGGTFTSPAGLMIFLFPGVITGVGLLLLLSQSRPQLPIPAQREAARENVVRLPRRAWIAIGAAALIPLFFACSWVHAASQLAIAKSGGVYPTVEEAIIAENSQGWGGAKVVRIEDVRATPNRANAQPHVWFGFATIYLDRIPAGYDEISYTSGSYYLHVREGWVLVPEGAFPGFIGWVMELYNMEGVD